MAQRYCVAVATLAIAFFAATCRSAKPAASFGPGTDELVAKTKAFNTAFATRDAEALAALMAPEYSFNWIDTNMMTTLRATPNAPRGKWSAELLARLSNGPLDWSVIDARIIGDTGIVVGYYHWRGGLNGQAFQYEGYVTDVWIKRRGTWRILLSNASLLPAVR